MLSGAFPRCYYARTDNRFTGIRGIILRMATRVRADIALVQRKFFESRARAQEAIAAGLVTANGAPVRKASESIAENAVIVAEQPHPYVSRGGVKLAGALDHFNLSPLGRICLDVGSSTGGFTDVLLRRGAVLVIAVDSGRDQLHASLRGDPRVALFESTDIRRLQAEDVPAGADLAVIDVSFIPLGLVLPAVAERLAPSADIIALIKPQFEVGRSHIGKGGIVRDDAVRLSAVETVCDQLKSLGFAPGEPILSPIAGGDGNVEYLVAARRRPA